MLFSGYTEAITTSFIPLEVILPEECAFIIGLTCTVWTKMRSLAGSLTDGVLADAILILPRPPIPPTNIDKVSDRENVQELVTKKHLLKNEKGHV